LKFHIPQLTIILPLEPCQVHQHATLIDPHIFKPNTKRGYFWAYYWQATAAEKRP
jgi:hypothetical protein